MSKDRIVIIGGDAAGMSAASKIRRAQPGRNILVLERTAFTSYSACGMPYFLGGLFDDFEQLIARSPETFREEYAIDVRTGHEGRVVSAIQLLDQLDQTQFGAGDFGRMIDEEHAPW